MKSKQKKQTKKRSGVALVWVAIVMTIFVGVISVFTVLFNGGLTQSIGQENHEKAYYLAEAGVEIGIKAATQPLGPIVGGVEETILRQFERSTAMAPITDTLNIGDGTVQITMSRFVDTNGNVWVRVEGEGKVVWNSKEYTEKVSSLVYTQDPLHVVRE